MKKLIATTCILVAISAHALAGEIPGGKTEPPPPPPPATTTTTSTTTSGLTTTLILTIISLIR